MSSAWWPARGCRHRSVCRGAVLGTVGFLGGAIAAAGFGAEPSAQVAPGTLVRWVAEGVERCGMGGTEFAPLGGACWYPIDLLTPPGSLEVVLSRRGVRHTATVEVGTYPYPVQEIELRDESKLHLSAEDLERVRSEQRRVARLWSRRGPRRFTLPLHPPLEVLSPGGRFGARRIFNGEPRSPHTGADYEAAPGVAVSAAAAGSVALAEEHFFAGNSVFIDHGDGLISMYFHLQEVIVEEGDGVERGQKIGTVGQTGRATGPHLHFGLRWRGARIDPSFLLGKVSRVEKIPVSWE